MEKIQFEDEVCEYLNIPSIPLKSYTNHTGSFRYGVAVTTLRDERLAYAVATFDAEVDKEPRIIKTFAPEPFYGYSDIFVVPEYMGDAEDINKMDLDEESKQAALALANEAAELESEEEYVEMPENEYFFEHIHNDEEALAFIQAYNSTNHIKGKLPKKHDTIVARLGVIWREEQERQK